MKQSIFSLTLYESPRTTTVFDSLLKSYASEIGFDSPDHIASFLENINSVYHFLIGESVWYHETPSVLVDCFILNDTLYLTFADKALPWRQSQLGQDLKTAVLQNNPIHIDRLEAFNLGKDGRLLQISKKIQPISPPSPSDSDQNQSIIEPTITYHQLPPEEADKAVDCMVIAYGYDYGIPDVYDVPQTRQLMSENLVHTLSAQTENGEIAGICTLRKRHAGSKIADLCQTMVNPKFHQKKLFQNLLEGTVNIANSQLKVQGLSATIPNKHYVSQKKLERIGFHPTGILLGCVPALVMPKQLGIHLGDRESFLLVYKPLQDPKFDSLYVPQPHFDMIQTLCQRLNISTSVEPAPYVDLPEKTTPSSKLRFHEVHNLNWLIIEMLSCGSDIIQQLMSALEMFKMRQHRAIQFYIDLSDPIAVSYLPYFEKMGFFFAGFFPDEKPYLVLQYLNNVVVQFDALDLPMPGAELIQQHVEHAYYQMKANRQSIILQKEQHNLQNLGRQKEAI